MKTNKTAAVEKTNTPAAAGFQTPHEKAKTQAKEKKAERFVWQPGDVQVQEKKSAKGKPSPKTTTPKETKKAGRDAWGGRLGTRMSKINLACINSGKEGATTAEIAEKTKEAPGLVSAQLVYHIPKGNVTRKEETTADGKKVVRWTAKAMKG